MSNQKSRLTRDFIRQVVHYYNNEPTTIEPTSKDSSQRKKLHTCKVRTHRFIADLEKTTCPRCSEKEIIIRNEQSTRTQ